MYPDILNYDQWLKSPGHSKRQWAAAASLVCMKKMANMIHEGRNNLGVVSLNLPRIALEARDEAHFYDLLDSRLRLCKKALMARIERLNGVKARVAPILYMEGACGVRLKADDDVSEIFKMAAPQFHWATSVHETINALFGDKVHVFDDEVLRQKGVAIVQKLRDAVDEWKAETGYGFSLYSTPSENLCSRFCNLDTKEFGLVDGVTEKGYYTNSYHLDVEKRLIHTPN